MWHPPERVLAYVGLKRGGVRVAALADEDGVATGVEEDRRGPAGPGPIERACSASSSKMLG
jgi:hypothetical protein